MPPPQPTPLNRDQSHPLLTSFPPFLLVAIHSLLYHRHLYPPTTFLSTRAYNLPVHQSRHPTVCAWIRSAVDALSIQLARGTVARVAVVMHAPAPSRAVLERWVFDTTAFPAWPAGKSREPARAMADFGRMMEREARGEEGRGRHGIELFPDPEVGGEGTSSRVRWPDVDEQLRGALRRLGHVAGGMGGLPEGSTYTVAVEMREEGRAPIEVCTFLGLVGFCCGLTFGVASAGVDPVGAKLAAGVEYEGRAGGGCGRCQDDADSVGAGRAAVFRVLAGGGEGKVRGGRRGRGRRDGEFGVWVDAGPRVIDGLGL